MMQLPLVIFDMDGLMLDSERIGWLAWEELLAPYGVEMTFDAYMHVIGTNQANVRAVAAAAWGDAFPVDGFLKAVWVRRMEKILEAGVPKKPGLVPLLQWLHGLEVPCAVATSSDRSSMEALLTAAGVRDFFNYTVCGDEVAHSKPHPEIFLKAAEKAGVDPQNAVVLEDSVNGIRAAHAAGMTGVFVRDLIDLPPDAAAMAAAELDSLHEVIAWLEGHGCPRL